jgi:hypothetical protein
MKTTNRSVFRNFRSQTALTTLPSAAFMGKECHT